MEIPERTALNQTLLLSGVTPDWHLTAPSAVTDAYEQSIEFESRTGLLELIADLRACTPSTFVHSQRLEQAVTQWGVASGLSTSEIVEAVASVGGHDVGKVAMAELIEYPGIYTSIEKRIVVWHARIGAELYDAIPLADESDELTKRQVAAQILCHHWSHDDPRTAAILGSLQGTILSPHDLHTVVRTSDMIDAGSNLLTRVDARMRFLDGMFASLQPDDHGGIRYDISALIEEIADGLNMGSDARVFSRSVGELVAELAVYLPPVLPEGQQYDPTANRFVEI